MRLLVLIAALLAGCATTAPPPAQSPLPPAPVEGAAPAVPAVPPAPAAPAPNPAVERLMASARADQAASRLGSAEATIERALRIAPRDPRLWQQLARIRLQQGDYRQAESLAARANTWAGSDDALRAENWNLIAQARDALGDSAGARAAQMNAERYAQ
jgi:tetratricopeptide (TPR) repeat protein